MEKNLTDAVLDGIVNDWRNSEQRSTRPRRDRSAIWHCLLLVPSCFALAQLASSQAIAASPPDLLLLYSQLYYSASSPDEKEVIVLELRSGLRGRFPYASAVGELGRYVRSSGGNCIYIIHSKWEESVYCEYNYIGTSLTSHSIDQTLITWIISVPLGFGRIIEIEARAKELRLPNP